MADNITTLIYQASTVACEKAAGLDSVKVTVRIDTIAARHTGNFAIGRRALPLLACVLGFGDERASKNT